MKGTTRGMCMALGAMVLAGSVAGAQSRGSGIPIRKGEAPTMQTTGSNPTANTTVSGGDVVPMAMLTREMIADWRDEQISAHWIGGDSLEVAISRLALSKAQSSAVRSFAQEMVDGHSRTMNEVKQLAAKNHFTPTPPANDPTPAHMMAVYNRLSSMAAGAAWDREFMNFQIMHHQHAVNMREALEDKAGDNDFEDWLQGQKGVLEDHLAKAKNAGYQVGATGTMNHSGH
jgi:putative membrane protein